MVFIPEQHYLWDFWLVSPHEWNESRGLYHLYYLQAPRTLSEPILRHGMRGCAGLRGLQSSALGLPSRPTSYTGNGIRAIHYSMSTHAGTSRRVPSNGRHKRGATPMLFTPQMRSCTTCSCLRVSM